MNGTTNEANATDTGFVALKSAWLRSLGLVPGCVHVLWAMGDSMLPTTRDGDMMLAEGSVDHVVDAGVCVIMAAAGVRVKLVTLCQNGSIVLRSDN